MMPEYGVESIIPIKLKTEMKKQKQKQKKQKTKQTSNQKNTWQPNHIPQPFLSKSIKKFDQPKQI